MACFLAPAAEAIVVTAIRAVVKKKESQTRLAQPADSELHPEAKRAPMSAKLGWLLNLLWGGCFLLCIEHIWHGEVVPWFPFLTAMNNPADVQPMLMEIATVGTSMAVLLTGVWCVMLIVYARIERRESAEVKVGA